MFPLGFLLVALGALLADSAYKNRNPIDVIKSIIADPSNARANIAAKNGTGFKTVSASYSVGSASVFPSPSASATGGNIDPRIAGVIAFARAQIGKPYIWGGTGPRGYDCSGLVQAAYASQGIHISRVVSTQALDGIPVNSPHDLLPGDLIMPTGLSHIQLYSGNGMVIEAASTKLGIRELPMWGFWRARRIISSNGTLQA